MPTTYTKDLTMKQPDSAFTKEDGWGADLSPADRPAVPKERPSNVTSVRGVVTHRQVPESKVYLSIEHPDLTPVFGTTCPPRGVSGRLRDYAYQLGEGRLARWMTLMLADRIDVVEGRLEDLTHGRLPNPVKERGWKAEISHGDLERQKRAAVMAGLGISAIALAAAVLVAKSNNGRS